MRWIRLGFNKLKKDMRVSIGNEYYEVNKGSISYRAKVGLGLGLEYISCNIYIIVRETT